MGSNVSGELTYAILASVLASFILTWILLAGYRRAVARIMRIASAQPEFEPSMVTPPEPSAQPHISAFATRRRLALVYSAATGLSALVLALPLIWKLVDEAGAWWWPGMVGHWLTLWAPSVILVCALLAARRRATILALFATWLLVVASAIVFSLLTRLMAGDLPASGLAANAWQTSKQFLVNAIVPLALVYVTGRPRLRNVLPLILVVVILLSFLLLAYNRGVMANQQEIAIAGTSILTWLGTEPSFYVDWALLLLLYSLPFLLLSLPVGVVAWRLLLLVERRYRARGFSNMQLVVDAWWATIVLTYVPSLAGASQSTGIVTCVLAYAIYWVTVRAGLRMSRLYVRGSGPTMLLLRVFGFQKRTERLFDRVAERWRFEGPVAMIAGADLALRSVDVDEALAFVRGDIESNYVAGSADLDRRLQELDAGADPDGRFRAGEFFCFDNTWRPTLRSLVARANVVLMDLRGFTKANAGCVFELEQLSTLGALRRCVLVVDSTTDRALAEASLGLTSENREPSGQPAWIMMKQEAAAMPPLWRALIQRAGESR